MHRRSAQPKQSAASKLVTLVRGALPGGAARARQGGGPKALISGLLAGKSGARTDRRRKPALIGLLGAGAAGAAVAAKRRKRSSPPQADEPQPVHESPAPSPPPPAAEERAPEQQ
jgi:hypothetical protein